MSDLNRSTLQRFYAAVNDGELHLLEELLADGFVEHEVVPGVPPTRDGVRYMFEMMRGAFPDYRMTVEDLLEDGDRIVVRGVMTGTHQGELFGVAATGNTVRVPFADFLRFDGGRIVEHWGVTDTGAMMQQLGEVD